MTIAPENPLGESVPANALEAGPISTQQAGPISQEQGGAPPLPGIGMPSPAPNAPNPGATQPQVSTGLAQTIAKAIQMGLASAPSTAGGWAKLADYYSTSAGEQSLVSGEASQLVQASQPTAGKSGPVPFSAGASPSPSVPTPSLGSSVTQGQFAAAVLKSIGAPVNSTNLSNLMSWMAAEGGNWNNTAAYNPLNTTLRMPGSSVMSGGNTAGVQAYTSWEQGLQATVDSLTNGYYGGIIAALKNSAPFGQFVSAVGNSPWGTGFFSQNVRDVTAAPYADAGTALSQNTTAVQQESAKTTNVVSLAKSQLGVPYQWGGESAGRDFDCSGLVQWAFKQAGVTLPRVAQTQYDATAKVPSGAPLQPGDLVFFGTGPNGISHVGIYIGNTLMIDAPHTGADVRVENYHWADFVGATRPNDPSGASTLSTAGVEAGTSAALAQGAKAQQQSAQDYAQILQQVSQGLALMAPLYPGAGTMTATGAMP